MTEEQKTVPEDEVEVEPVSFSNGSGGNRSHLLCKVGESKEACIERHSSAGWSVSDANSDVKEIDTLTGQLKLVFKQS